MIRGIVACGCGSRSASFGGPGVFAASSFKTGRSGGGGAITMSEGCCGDIGSSVTQSHGTFSLAAAVRIPIYQGGRIRADVEQADAQLQQRRSEAEDLRGKIDNDVRTAFLDLRSAEEQLRLAQSSIQLAKQQLQQSQDRFGAGVTNNIEVVQAQESVVASNDNFISSLYSYNLAKASLARALGLTPDAFKRFIEGAK